MKSGENITVWYVAILVQRCYELAKCGIVLLNWWLSAGMSWALMAAWLWCFYYFDKCILQLGKTHFAIRWMHFQVMTVRCFVWDAWLLGSGLWSDIQPCLVVPISLSHSALVSSPAQWLGVRWNRWKEGAALPAVATQGAPGTLISLDTRWWHWRLTGDTGDSITTQNGDTQWGQRGT